MSTKTDARQIVSRQALGRLLGINGTQLDTLLASINKNANSPIRMFVSNPADARINFESAQVESADLVAQEISPIDSQVPTFVASSINFQTQATTGGTFNVTWPASTVGFFRRVGFTLDATGTMRVIFSPEVATVGALANPGSVFFSTGIPVGWIDLECTNVLGYFKTIASATNIIEAKTSGINRVHRIDTPTLPRANQSLSNLETTSINADLLPSATLNRNLGSSSLLWLNSFLSSIRSASGEQINVTNRQLTFNGSAVLSWFTGGIQVVASKLLRFETGNSQTIGLQAPASAPASVDYTLPAAAPTVNGQVLASTTAGVTSWVTPSGDTSPIVSRYGPGSTSHTITSGTNWVRITAVGGGGGGGFGSSTGGTGGSTSIAGYTTVTGGGGGSPSTLGPNAGISIGGNGGFANQLNGNMIIVHQVIGGGGGSGGGFNSFNNIWGPSGPGGNNPMGGGGAADFNSNASTFTGGGGGGYSSSITGKGGGGGGAGGFIQFILKAPNIPGSFSISVGSGGGGAAGSNSGGAGIIVFEEYK